MNSYAYWKTYIAGGRSKIDRPIGGSRTKRAYLSSGGVIRLRLHNTDVVTLYPDGTESIYVGGWNTVTTKRFLSEHSRARVWSEKGQLYVRVADPTLTPPRVQKCRMCHGAGTLPQTCYGPGYCYSWGSGQCEHGETDSHKREMCQHGETTQHALAPGTCYRCDGEGRVDYGSNPIHYRWDGGPLTIDADGYPVLDGKPTAASKPKPAPKPAATSGTDYGDSGRLLRAELPALEQHVTCPHCGINGALEAVIIHLNDKTGWTRGQVADWLDTLDLDLSFPVPDHIPAHIH